MLNAAGFFIARELERRGYVVTELGDDMLYMVEKNGQHHFFHSVKNDQMNALAYLICQNKWYTKQILQKFGIPTARGVLLMPRSGEIDVTTLRFPLVLKPLSQFGGAGVSVNINSLDEIDWYLKHHPWYARVLAEETLHGSDYRMMTVRGKFFAACQRLPPSVVGDGRHTVQELLLRENQQRQSWINEDKKQQTYIHDIYLIPEDAEFDRTLQGQGFKRDSVPADGEKIWLRHNANISTGGQSIDVTDQVSAVLRSTCEQICDIFHADTLGIDIMTEDLQQPLNRDRGWGIVEVNGSPGYSLHSLVHVGKKHDPVKMMIDEWEAAIRS